MPGGSNTSRHGEALPRKALTSRDFPLSKAAAAKAIKGAVMDRCRLLGWAVRRAMRPMLRRSGTTPWPRKAGASADQPSGAVF